MLSLLKRKLRKSRNEKETSMDQKIILSDILPGYSQFKTTLLWIFFKYYWLTTETSCTEVYMNIWNI